LTVRLSWQERGVKVRGGEAPSHKFSPPLTQDNYPIEIMVLSERGIKGGENAKQPDAKRIEV